MTELLNKRYDLRIDVLTPLHIGAGTEKDWFEGLDFIYSDGKVIKLNIDQVANLLGADELTSIILNKHSKLLWQKLGSNQSKCLENSFDFSIRSDNSIKAQIKNGISNQPIIPGSSIKGAIRSVLFSYLRDNESYENQIFGTPQKGDEFMRFIKLSDSEFGKTQLANTKIFNLVQSRNGFMGYWKHSTRQSDEFYSDSGFNTIYEIIPPGETSFISIGFNESGFSRIVDHSKYRKKSQLIIGGIVNLFEIINNHTKEFIEKEIDFFEKYPNDETETIIANLEIILNSIPDDNLGCILRMSAGSGFHNITGDWQFEESHEIDEIRNDKGRNRGYFNGRKSAKSRKIVKYDDNLFLMGFVRLTQSDGKNNQVSNNKEYAQVKKPLIEDRHISILKSKPAVINKPPKPDWVEAKIIGNKQVEIEGFDYSVNMVIPKHKLNLETKVGMLVWVTEKQRSKEGKLIQVEFQERF